MAIFKKQQTPTLTDSTEKIYKKLPNELLVDIFDSITTEEFWNIFYPFYMRDNILTDNENELIKQHNITTKNKNREPFKKWSECVKNWLSSSAIIFILERETFKKRHVTKKSETMPKHSKIPSHPKNKFVVRIQHHSIALILDLETI
ncbi:unnamed protein product [Meloidogyne enterolobii]|uniref:Uncharacterized protein n=1 Tax=Meloidogyne enterolobii TaxID=390850 RepID=A0ACB0ZEQ5_MELEN